MSYKELNLDLKPLAIIEQEFKGLYSGELGLSSISGGQSAANLALAQLDITHYADRRSEVLPKNRRGASVLSPYIRHNILTLKQVHDAVKSAPYKDREKFRDELYWQEYARLGTRLFSNLRFEANWSGEGDGWNRKMCVNEDVDKHPNLSSISSNNCLVEETNPYFEIDSKQDLGGNESDGDKDAPNFWAICLLHDIGKSNEDGREKRLNPNY